MSDSKAYLPERRNPLAMRLPGWRRRAALQAIYDQERSRTPSGTRRALQSGQARMSPMRQASRSSKRANFGWIDAGSTSWKLARAKL